MPKCRVYLDARPIRVAHHGPTAVRGPWSYSLSSPAAKWLTDRVQLVGGGAASQKC